MGRLDLGQVIGPQGPQGPVGPTGPQGNPASVNGVLPDAEGNIELGIENIPELSTALSNKAPAGFGLGGLAQFTNDLNACIVNGWYYTGQSTANVPSVFLYSSVLVKTRIKCIEQELTAMLNNGVPVGTKLVRRSQDDGATWVEEWVNPPMQLGVEYRTTERYLGKPVYTQLVDFGAMPNASSSTITVYDLNADMCLKAEGVTDKGRPFPYTTTNAVWGTVELFAQAPTAGGNIGVMITTTSDMTAYKAYVRLWYTKTTD